MFDGLKNIAKSAFSNGEEIDRILALPLIGLRMELKKAFQKKHFPQEAYEGFVSRLSTLEDLTEQKTLVEEALASGRVQSSLDIDLSTPAQTLLWAAALTRLMQSSEKPIAQSEIWQQLQETRSACNEKIMTGRVVYSSLQNDDTSIMYGQPGSWFYYNPKTNQINLDFYFTLMMGFEHVRSINLHEIGHGELSNKFSPRMQELYEKLKDFIDPSTAQSPQKLDEKFAKMTDDEKKELALLSREWELRFMLWHMVEDNCVDQFATNMSEAGDNFYYRQDFGYSKNVMFTALQGFGELARGDKEDIDVSSDKPRQQLDEASKRIEEDERALKKQQSGQLTPEQKQEFDAAKKALEQNKKSLEEQVKKIKDKVALSARALTDAEVREIRKGKISPELAGKMFNQAKTAVLTAFYAHNKLFRGTDNNWQRFRIFPEDIRKVIDVSAVVAADKKDSFAYLVDLSAGKQGINTLQPQPKDRYFGKEHYQKRVEETTDERIKVMDHIWDLYLDKFAKVLLQEFKKDLEQELDQQGQSGQQGKPGQQGQGQGQGEPGEGAPGEGQPGQGKGGGKPQQGGGGGKSISDALKEKIKNMKATPEEKREAERDEAGQEKGTGADAGKDKSQDKEAPGGKGWDQSPDANKDQPQDKVGDLRQKEIIGDLTPEQKEAMKQSMKALGKGGQGAQAGRGRGLDLSALAKGDWKDFNRRVLELSPIINSVADALKKIREAQKKQVMKLSKDLDFMAEDGDVQTRLDRDKVLETKYRQAAKVPLKGEDFKKFQEDKICTNYSTIEFYQMIDGSGSMPGLKLTNTTTAMEAALQSAVIMYMACRKAGIDAYIMMWGDPDPTVIARPDSDLKKVGQALEALRNGTSSGTSLAPGLKKSIGEMAEHVNKNGTISGSSHIQIYSDGDIADDAAAQASLETIARNSKNLTVDIAVLRPPGDNNKTDMEKVADRVIKSVHSKMISVIRGHDANEVPKELARLLLRRVKRIEVKSEPDRSKRSRLKKLHDKMIK